MHIVGARPNFMKVAPIIAALARRQAAPIRQVLVHTGQHYSPEMSDLFFRELGLPDPDINLEVGSGSHAQQTARIMEAFEPVLVAERPDAVLVVGDVNSTIACALVATKLGVRVVHVEAGLRSFDRTMPEEVNRVLTDQISDLLFTTEAEAATNLAREGIAGERVRFVGNVMIDTLLRHRERALARPTLAEVVPGVRLARGGYGIVTLHRPSNVDDDATLAPLLAVLADIARELPLVFPVHPRTRGSIERLGGQLGNLHLVPAQGYLDFLNLMANARLVLTDSGGVQEETTILGVPCLTLRENTERPVTISHGSNVLVGTQPQAIRAAATAALAATPRDVRPPLWDGQAGERIAEVLDGWL
jgi:UDP-N-acetylglucosamine 2-epimerase (non-hydrolysing)